MSRRLVFIINPISGIRGKGSLRKERVEAFLERSKLEAEVFETEWRNHASEIAREALASGADRLICVGGDGTINEVAREIVGTPCEFGLVPMGSGNGLARHLGIPLGFDKALDLAVNGEAVRIDSGEADGRPFFNVMGVGFDAEVGRRFNESPQRGILSYLKEGWGAYRNYRCRSYRIESNTATQSIDAYIVAVANSSQYGNNAFIAPDASLTDGKLNLVAIAQPSFVSLFVLMWRMFRKKLYLSPRVTPLCSESFTLSLGGAGFFHVDGEIHPCGSELRIRTCPRSLSIVSKSG